MLTQYRLSLHPDSECHPRPEWGYRLYAALLEKAPADFGAVAHRGSVTPVSQHLSTKPDGDLLWTVNLLGETAENALSEVLEKTRRYSLKKAKVSLEVTQLDSKTVADADELFSLAAEHGSGHQLHFRTATAFKSQGNYLNLPTPRLIVQSLIKKWNGCIIDCPIEDEDDEGLDAVADGLRIKSFALNGRLFYLKGNSIPGFVGELAVENRLNGFHRRLLDAMLLFSDYSGVGIKTTLGMGGVEHK